ncbi:MAG TPA: O-antigen ligase family protein [Bryobacteraceae bacterium]|nr:O-antigen ligase family protein [Bryobacteraceae bacterium]
MGERLAATGIFLAAAAATLTIAVPTPLAAWAYALAVLVGACWWSVYSLRSRDRHTPASGVLRPPDSRARGSVLGNVAMLAIAAWGAVEWLTGATVYRYGTFDAWTHTVTLVATALVAREVLANHGLRCDFLCAFAWFAVAVSGAGVLAYFTSSARILWLFPSPYPDTWGPFLSRNDFAAFLELAFPVALWLGLDGAVRSSPGERRNERNRRGHAGGATYVYLAAWLLAAGFASASRAGSVLLAAEAVVLLAVRATRSSVLKFAASAAVLVAVAGAGTLAGRWREPDPLHYRREIRQSTLEMIAARPLRGFGLGTYSRVYPAYGHFDLGALVEHAHNDWLEWAAEGGVPYALAWFAVAVSVAKPAARSIWGLGVIAVFLHALVDYPFARFGVSAWTMALIGALGADEMRKVSVRAH